MAKIQRSSAHENNKRVIIIASIIGLLDSAYLSYVKLFNTPIYCTPGLGDCDVVNASRWSVLLGIPIAILGFATFLAILLLATLGEKNRFINPYANLMLFGISLIGFLFSLYLTGIEIFILRTYCQWCVLSFILITLIFVASILRLVVKSPEQ